MSWESFSSIAIPVIVGLTSFLGILCYLTWICICCYLVRFGIRKGIHLINRLTDPNYLVRQQMLRAAAMGVDEEIIIAPQNMVDEPRSGPSASLAPVDEEGYQKRREIIPQEETCVVCLDFRKVVEFLPCKHVCCCQNCANDIMSKESNMCPLCRVNITGFKVDQEKIRLDEFAQIAPSNVKYLSGKKSMGLVKENVNQLFLNKLLLMGYDEIKALKALRETGNESLNDAVNWIISHFNDGDINDQIRLVDGESVIKGDSNSPVAKCDPNTEEEKNGETETETEDDSEEGEVGDDMLDSDEISLEIEEPEEKPDKSKRKSSRGWQETIDLGNDEKIKKFVNEHSISSNHMNQLTEMGYSKLRAAKALAISKNNMNKAVFFLYENQEDLKLDDEVFSKQSLEKMIQEGVHESEKNVSTEIDKECLEQLKQMGYDENSAKKALIESNNTLHLAIESLLKK